ncbi:MAG TPA: type I restriction endonuclease [bacterium]
MDFTDKIQELAAKVPKQLSHITTEEATKSALVMPFINALGYNVFDPTEVVPEFTADIGIKKGEKVDYALFIDGKLIMLFECKWCSTNLNDVHSSQLFRYFSATDARIAVLTNGVIYRFYTDLEQPNRMDSKPFLEIDLLNLNESLLFELKKLGKSNFDLEEVISRASDLKYTREIKRILNDQLISPGDDFVRFLAAQVYSGKLTQSVREQFQEIVKKAFGQFISDKINDRLKSALSQEAAEASANEMSLSSEEEKAGGEARDKEIDTTPEELEAYYIVKSILRETIDPARIVHRDTMSYFGVLLDDNNRKPICRLHLSGEKKKYLGLFDENKKEERIELQELNDIYKYASRLKSTVAAYEK